MRRAAAVRRGRTTEREVRPDLVVVALPDCQHRAHLRQRDEQVSFRHSSRSRPMKLSANAFCRGSTLLRGIPIHCSSVNRLSFIAASLPGGTLPKKWRSL